MKMILKLVAAAVLAGTPVTASASAECPEGVTAAGIQGNLGGFHIQIHQLKKMRKWARENGRPEIEKATNKLEYWIKDMTRFSDRYVKTNFEAVCTRLFETDSEYLWDLHKMLRQQGLDFVNYRHLDERNIDWSKYE